MIRTYDARGRGMDFWHDVRDSVGDFPYEYATAGEVFTDLDGKHGLELVLPQHPRRPRVQRVHVSAAGMIRDVELRPVRRRRSAP